MTRHWHTVAIVLAVATIVVWSAALWPAPKTPEQKARDRAMERVREAAK